MENYKYLFPVLLIGFLIYRRVQKTIGFQKFSPARLKFRIVLFSIVSLLILGLTILKPISLIFDLIGIAVGITLVYFAIKNTIFENRSEGLFYRTHIWIELTVLLLFFARLFYRFYKMSVVMNNIETPREMQDKLNDIRDPSTAAVFFVICTYYIGYFIFILRSANAELQKSKV